MKLKVLLFCGDRSPYGLAHLIPLLKSKFDVIGVIVPTEDRWNYFQEALLGKAYYQARAENTLLRPVKEILKRLIPVQITRFLKEENKKINIATILRNYRVPLIRVFDVNEHRFLERVREMNPDLIFSAAYPQIMSKDLISMPRKGSVNFHPSLLPKYRGAHPHFWVIAKGEKITGLTAHFMTENIDDGDVIAQIAFPIEEYTYHELYEKIKKETPTLLENVERFFCEKETKAIPQDHSKGSYFSNDREIHKRIFWTIHSSREIRDLIRTEQAFCFFRGRRVKFRKAYTTDSNRNLTNNVCVESGTVVDVCKDCVVVKTTDGCINIQEFEEGGRKIPFNKWARKHSVHIGEKFD